MFVYSKILSIRNSKIVVQNISDKKEIEKISKKHLDNKGINYKK